MYALYVLEYICQEVIALMPMTIKEAERMLKFMGFIEVKGGKGSHRKFEKAGERPFILPNHQKELSKIVESTLNKALKKFEEE